MSVFVYTAVFLQRPFINIFIYFLYPSVDTERVAHRCIFHALLIIHLCLFNHAAVKVSVKSSGFYLKPPVRLGPRPFAEPTGGASHSRSLTCPSRFMTCSCSETYAGTNKTEPLLVSERLRRTQPHRTLWMMPRLIENLPSAWTRELQKLWWRVITMQSRKNKNSKRAPFTDDTN